MLSLSNCVDSLVKEPFVSDPSGLRFILCADDVPTEPTGVVRASGLVREQASGDDCVYEVVSRLGNGLKGVAYKVKDEAGKEWVAKIPRITPQGSKYRGMSREESSIAHIQTIREEAVSFRKNFSEAEYISPRLEGCKSAAFLVKAGWCCIKDGESVSPILVTIQPLVPDDYAILEDSLKPGAGSKHWQDIALSVARAISEVHSRRVVHADLWPPNIFIRKDNKHAMLIDFGESWSPEVPSEKAFSDPNKWQHPYKAPERQRLTSKNSEAVDVYSFGAILLWLAIGNKTPKENYIEGSFKLLTRKNFAAALQEWSVRQDQWNSDQLEDYSKFLIEETVDVPVFVDAEDRPFAYGEKWAFFDEFAIQKSKNSRATKRKVLELLLQDKEVLGSGTLVERAKDLAKRATLDPGLPQRENAQESYQIREQIRDIFLKRQNFDLVTESPWLVDLIVNCCDNDPAKRPRMVDVTRQIADRQTAIRPELATISDIARTVKRSLEELDEIADKCRTLDGSLLTHMLAYRILTLSDITGVREGSRTEDRAPGTLEGKLLDISDNRDLIIDHLCWLVQSLGSKSWFATMTTLSVWHKDAYGINGRYMSSNVQAVINGLTLIRCFSISIEALGESWWIDLLTRMAIRGCNLEALNPLERRETVSKIHKEILQGKLEKFDALSILTPIQNSCFHELVRAVSIASEKLGALRGFGAIADPPFSEIGKEYILRVQSRELLRRRFTRVIKSYWDIFEIWNFEVEGGWGAFRKHQRSKNGDKSPSVIVGSCPSIVNSSESSNGVSRGHDLYLGLAIRPSVDEAMKTYNDNPRTIVSRSGDILLFDTECQGRGDLVFNDSPKLTRIRMYQPFNEGASDTRSKLNHVLQDEQTVNVGPLVPLLLKAGLDMDNRQSSLIDEEEFRRLRKW